MYTLQCFSDPIIFVLTVGLLTSKEEEMSPMCF